MIRFFFIFLLAAVAARQVLPTLKLVANLAATELCSLCDETEGEETNKPDPKAHNEDKLHHYNSELYSLQYTLKQNPVQASQNLYRSFYDQPNTPPPNLA